MLKRENSTTLILCNHHYCFLLQHQGNIISKQSLGLSFFLIVIYVFVKWYPMLIGWHGSFGDELLVTIYIVVMRCHPQLIVREENSFVILKPNKCRHISKNSSCINNWSKEANLKPKCMWPYPTAIRSEQVSSNLVWFGWMIGFGWLSLYVGRH